MAGRFWRSGRLQEPLRRSDGSSEGVTHTGVLGGGNGQDNVVGLYNFVRLCLLGSRKARPACASPRRPCARWSCRSRTTPADALANRVKAGEKGVQDDCGEGHMALLGQAITAALVLGRLALLAHVPLVDHCYTSESPTRNSSAPSAISATPRSLPT